MEQVDPNGDSAQMVKEADGKWVLIDGFGNPWQYRHGDENGAINETYDLWSYGDAELGTFTRGLTSFAIFLLPCLSRRSRRW